MLILSRVLQTIIWFLATKKNMFYHIVKYVVPILYFIFYFCLSTIIIHNMLLYGNDNYTFSQNLNMINIIILIILVKSITFLLDTCSNFQ